MMMMMIMIMMMMNRSDTDVFLESWSDYEPHEEYDDVYIETPIDYMEVSSVSNTGHASNFRQGSDS